MNSRPAGLGKSGTELWYRLLLLSSVIKDSSITSSWSGSMWADCRDKYLKEFLVRSFGKSNTHV